MPRDAATRSSLAYCAGLSLALIGATSCGWGGYANAVGALTSLTQGVIPALPTAAAVDEFLTDHGS